MDKVYVIDACMGSGKTSAMINMINQSSDAERFIYVTPLLSETERIAKACESKKFAMPKALFDKDKNIMTKKEGLIKLLRTQRNVVTTHAMFRLFDDSILEMCREYNYTLVLDETTEVINEYKMTRDDYLDFINSHSSENDDGTLKWVNSAYDSHSEQRQYNGAKFLEEKALFTLGTVIDYKQNCLLYVFPIKIFEAFSRTFILTYLFDGQIQKYYYDYYGISYEYLYVTGTRPDNYKITSIPQMHVVPSTMKHLIHISDNSRMNSIGESYYSLSRTWFQHEGDKTYALKDLRNNMFNYFYRINHSNSANSLWSVFNDFESSCSPHGYSKSFLYCNCRATNMYKDVTTLAYGVNLYLNPVIKNFFTTNYTEVDEDMYALSTMIQWIWRSAIRDGKDINLYLPSSRMRRLLNNWLDDMYI